MGKIKRKLFIVDRSLQYKLIGVVAIYFIVILGVVAITLFLPLFQNLSAPDLDLAHKAFAAETALSIHLRFWPAFISIAAILLIHSIFVFHRIAGPIYRFRMFYKSVSVGNLSGTIKIRRNDYLHTDERLLNEMLEGLRTRVDRVNTEYYLLRDDLHELGSMVSADVNTELAERMGKTLEQSDALERALKEFKYHGEP